MRTPNGGDSSVALQPQNVEGLGVVSANVLYFRRPLTVVVSCCCGLGSFDYMLTIVGFVGQVHTRNRKFFVRWQAKLCLHRPKDRHIHCRGLVLSWCRADTA